VKKSIFYGLTVILLVSLTVLAACTPEATTTAPPAGTTAPATTSAPPAEKIEIIAQHSNPAAGGAAKVFKAFGDRIEVASKGQVEFTYYWSSSLVPSAEVIKAVDSGALDVGYTGGPIANYMPMSWYWCNLPFMGIPSMEIGNKMFWELYNSIPEMAAEWKGFKPLMINVMPPQEIHSAKSPIIVPSDVKGHKVCITSAGPMSTLISELDGAPVNLLPPDLVVSLNSGVVDSFFDHFPVALVFGAIPLLPYHTIVGQHDDQGIAYGTHGMIMKEERFNSLPADIQQMFEDSAQIYAEEILAVDRDVEIARGLAEATDLDHEIVYLTPEQVQLWMDAALPVHQSWIDEYEAKGKPAQKVYDMTKDLIEKYSK
jgi:TRAP-type C4-dicarboxylate transport system substrate-binding protein